MSAPHLSLVPTDDATLAEVTRLEDLVATDLEHALDVLAGLRTLDAHTRRGFDTWAAYVLDRFGGLLARFQMTRDERLPLVRALKEDGKANRTIASTLGVSPGTIAGDVKHLRAVGDIDEPDKVTGADGIQRPARGRTTGTAAGLIVTWPADRYAGLSRMLETVARIADAGDAGRTSLELDSDTGWPMGTATGNLSRLHQRQGLLALTDTRRGGRGAYVVTDLGRARLAAARG